MKKLLSLALVAMMILGLVPLFAQAEEPVALKWVTVGGGKADNYETWKAKVDPYLTEKIGVTLDLEVLGWGAYDDKRNAMINGGEYFDIVFTNSGSYSQDIDKGALLDIAPLLDKDAPELKKLVPEDMWKAVTVKGGIYAVPTLKDSALAQYFVWDPVVLEKLGVDVSELNTLEKIEPVLKKMKEADPEKAPFILTRSGVYQMLDVYDTLGMGMPLVGVRYDDKDAKVVSIFEQPEIMDQLKLLARWMKEGLINADASTLDEGPKYRPVFLAQGWPNAWMIEGVKDNGEAYKVLGKTVLFVGPISSNDTIMGSMNGIYAGAKRPDKALALLQLVNTDTKLRDMICYGEEGLNFEYKDGLVVPNPDKGWTWPRYTQGNHAIITPTVDNPDLFKEIAKVNTDAVRSVVSGFQLDRSQIEDELALLKGVYAKYSAEIITGAREPDEVVPAMVNELKAQDLEKVIEEAQKQVNAFLGK